MSLYLHMKAINAVQEELFRVIPSRNVKHFFHKINYFTCVLYLNNSKDLPFESSFYMHNLDIQYGEVFYFYIYCCT